MRHPVCQLIVAVALCLRSAAHAAEALTPPEVLREFQIALALKDEPSIRQLAMPDPDLDVLWSGPTPDIEQLNGIYLTFGEMKIRQLDLNDSVVIEGRKIRINREMVGEDRALVCRELQGREDMPLVVVKAKGRWRLDASPFVQMGLQRAGRSPRKGTPEVWEDLFELDQLLARSPRLWDARLVDLSRSEVGRSFQIDSKQEATATYQPDAQAGDRPSAFGRPLQDLVLRFEDGLLAEVVGTVYDDDTAEEKMDTRDTQRAMARLDKGLSRLAGTKGRFRRARRDSQHRDRSVRAKEWEALGMLLRLEVVLGPVTVPDAQTGETKTISGPVVIRIIAADRPETGDDALQGDRSLPKELREALATMGTPISPASANFWQQTKTSFLGSFVGSHKAHWTEEQGQDGIVNYRSTYIQIPEEDRRADRPGFFVHNEPLAGSGLTLFDKPVVAMVASFQQDRLVQFRFDFWNKGDAAAGKKAIDEDEGEDAFKDVMERLKKAKLDFSREGGSSGRVSRVRETHYVADAGPTRVTFVKQREEYYSLLLESSRFVLDQEEGPRETLTSREVRKSLEERVIRIDSEEEARKHPGLVEIGDVFLQVPMVDQGPKGYCAPATLNRVVLYYGRQATLNEMAAMMETDGSGGTLLSDVRDGVRKVTRRLHMSFREEDTPDRNDLGNERRLDRWVTTAVTEYIEHGNPIFWTVPEHQRLIIGYNARTREILYSDSWGRKGYDRMSYQEAAEATQAIWIIR
jgi:hypothetical protein